MMRRYLLGVLLDDPLLFVLEPHVRAAIDTKVIIIWYLLSGLIWSSGTSYVGNAHTSTKVQLGVGGNIRKGMTRHLTRCEQH